MYRSKVWRYGMYSKYLSLNFVNLVLQVSWNGGSMVTFYFLPWLWNGLSAYTHSPSSNYAFVQFSGRLLNQSSHTFFIVSFTPKKSRWIILYQKCVFVMIQFVFHFYIYYHFKIAVNWLFRNCNSCLIQIYKDKVIYFC